MTFEERLAELGVDLSDLPDDYSMDQCASACIVAGKWAKYNDHTVPFLYILHLTDIIDCMETRLVNVTGERDYLIDRYVGCEDCAYGADAKLCEEPCVSCENMEHFEWIVPEWIVPEDWRPDE